MGGLSAKTLPRSSVAFALVFPAATFAVLLSALGCVLLQQAVPPGHGPEISLFQYGGETVAIGLAGGGLPLLVSLALVASLVGGSGEDDHAPFRSEAYWAGVLLIAIFVTGVFSASGALYGGLGIPRVWAFWLVVAGGAAGVGYWMLRGKSLGLAAGAAECYVMGTLGVFASDVIRTLSGQASAPGELAVWGGGGLLDVFFWFGIYVALSFVGLRVLLGTFTRAYQAALKAATPPVTR
jgi:hypothetical protein